MADAQRTIDLIFNGVDKTGAATQAVLNNLGKFSGTVETATQPIADFTVGALKLEAGILAAGAAMTVFAVKTAAEFDVAFKQISTLFEATDADVAAFRDAILDYASTSSKSLEDITNSISAAVGSGVEYSKSIELIATAEKLAVATRADLKGTTEVLVSTLNAYGLSTDKAGEVSDLFFKIIADGKIEMDELSQYLANLTSVAAAAGISLEEIGAGIATLTAAGIQPSTAIDALRSAISNIIKPSEQAKNMAAELGIEFDANALKSKGLAGVLDEVQKATGGSADKMAVLFGDVQGLTAVLTLTGAQAETFKTSIESMGNAAGAVDAAFLKMTGSVEEAGAKIQSALKVLLVNIGDPLLDEFGGVAEAVAQIFAGLSKSVKDGALGELVKYIESIAGDLEEAFQDVAKNLPAALAKADLSGFKNGIDVVIAAVKNLFGGIDVTTTDGLTRSIEFLGAAFLGLSKYVAGAIESFKPMFDVLVRLGEKASEVDSDVFELAGNFGGVVTQLNLMAGGINSLLPMFEALLGIMVVRQGAGLVGAMGSLATRASGLAGALGAAGLVGAAGAAGYALGTMLNDPINRLVSTMTGTETTLGGWIYDLVNAGEDAEAFGVTVDGLRVSLDDLNKGVESGKYVWDDVTQAWTNAEKASSSLADGLDGVAGAVTKVTTGPVTEYVDALGNVVKRTVESQEALDAWNEAMLASGGVTDEVVEGAENLADANKAVFDTTSKIIPIFDAATGKIIGYEQNLLAGVDATGKLGKSAKEIDKPLGNMTAQTERIAEATRLWNQEVAKMNHAEKLKLIEQQTQVATKQIEADAQKAVAAYESISVAIDSTGTSLTEMLGLLGNGKLGIQDWNTINKEIGRESTRRDEALKLQKELTQAQIKMMNAQVEAIQNGDGMIKIDGAGLQPHLEAFMWEILKSIQVRVNQDGLKMLLGV